MPARQHLGVNKRQAVLVALDTSVPANKLRSGVAWVEKGDGPLRPPVINQAEAEDLGPVLLED